MRTIETQATITGDGRLIVPVSQDFLPGSYRVVIVIDEPVEPDEDLLEASTGQDAFTNVLRLGQEISELWPSGTQSADILSEMRDER